MSNYKIIDLKFENFIFRENKNKIDFKTKKETNQTFDEKLLNEHFIFNRIGILGANSSGKTIFLKSINNIFNFVFYGNYLWEEVVNIIFKKINKNSLSNVRSISKLLSFVKKGSNLDNYEKTKNKLEQDWKIILPNKETMNNKYIEKFYNNNVWNKKKPLKFTITFLKDSERYCLDISLEKIQINDKEEFNFFKQIKLNNKKMNSMEFNEKFNDFKFIFLPANKNIDNFNTKKNNHRDMITHFYKKFNNDSNKITKMLSLIDESIIDVKIIETLKEKYEISKVTRKFNEIHKDINFSDLSYGTRKMIIMLYLVDKYDFILIDEIENGLHFKLLKKIFDISKKKNTQIIFSTHNPVICEELLDKTKNLFLVNRTLDPMVPGILKINKLGIRPEHNLLKRYLNDYLDSPETYYLDELDTMISE